MLVKRQIVINSGVKKVWRVFSQIEEWPTWGGYILKAKWLSKEKWKVGSRFTQTIKGFLGFKVFNSYPKVIEARPFSRVTWAGTRLVIRGIHTFEFEKIGNKTKVTNIECFKGPLAPIIFPLIKSKFELDFEQFLDGLKREAENS